MKSLILTILPTATRLIACLFISTSWGYSATRDSTSPEGESLTIIDERAPDEISEVSRLYLNGQLAATFKLNLNHNTEQATIPLPLGRMSIPYTLCGTITIMQNGHIETRSVSGEGILHNPNGHIYEAVSSEEFKKFFLINENDPDATEQKNGRPAICATATS